MFFFFFQVFFLELVTGFLNFSVYIPMKPGKVDKGEKHHLMSHSPAFMCWDPPKKLISRKFLDPLSGTSRAGPRNLHFHDPRRFLHRGQGDQTSNCLTTGPRPRNFFFFFSIPSPSVSFDIALGQVISTMPQFQSVKWGRSYLSPTSLSSRVTSWGNACEVV